MILASGSPQRRAILAQLGVDFTVVASGAQELSAGDPEHVARENAVRKARAIAGGLVGHDGGNQSATPVLGVDTVVELDGSMYGKPEDRERAQHTLRALAGRTHRVLSGVCVITGAREQTELAVTEVSFRPLTEAAIAWYLDTEEWRERAGGYAIQGRGAVLVQAITGDYLNVVGLPVATLVAMRPSPLFPAVF